MDLLEKYAAHGLIHGDLNEFNLMVDESQKVWTIDFPQMVSTGHPDAEFYFERDQTCVHTLFKRKFGLVSDRVYKLADIAVARHLDKEVKASGASKLTADDLALAEHHQRMLDAPEQEGDAADLDDGSDDGHDADDLGEGGDDGDGRPDDDNHIELTGKDELETADLEAAFKDTLGDPALDSLPQLGEDPGQDEDVDWEAQIEKRKMMKALKKEKLAANKPKYMTSPPTHDDQPKPPLEDPANLESSDGDDDSEKETELIKKALKKKYKKKKVFKTNKNHPKQFNEAVKDQMGF